MTISIGNDHAGVEYKQELTQLLQSMGHTLNNHGTDTEDSVDYPDFAHPVSLDVAEQNAALGILICGSGNGVCMTANKHAKVRAALCWDVELATLARQHNNANIICIPARFVSLEIAKEMVIAFLKTDFEGGRHERRVGKISLEIAKEMVIAFLKTDFEGGRHERRVGKISQ